MIIAVQKDHRSLICNNSSKAKTKKQYRLLRHVSIVRWSLLKLESLTPTDYAIAGEYCLSLLKVNLIGQGHHICSFLEHSRCILVSILKYFLRAMNMLRTPCSLKSESIELSKDVTHGRSSPAQAWQGPTSDTIEYLNYMTLKKSWCSPEFNRKTFVYGLGSGC